MLLAIIASALLCSSVIRADSSISFFYPNNIQEESCAGTISWTKWFNSAKPSDNNGADQELLSNIQGTAGRDVCPTPLAMQAQPAGSLNGYTSFSASWTTRNNIIFGFISNNRDLDFQVRFCCPNNAFNPTTTTTTTPRPMTSSTCGRAAIPNSITSARIFGGSAATPNSWPWQVLYEEKKACGVNQICTGLCGGTLIDSRHVLTAAHCVNTQDPSTITITAGLHNKLRNEDFSRQVRRVERIFKHPAYNPGTNQNDLTILRLAEPVQFNQYVQPACLPGPEPQANDDVVLIGWGALQLNGGAYHELKQTKMKVVGQCYKYWGSKVDEDKQVCVAHPTSGDSACQGDSGGPMLYQRNGQWIVSGVASFVSGNGCRTDENSPPNVYVRVSAYLPWINSII